MWTVSDANLAAIARTIPVRSTNKYVRSTPTATPAHAAPKSDASAMQFMMNMMNMMTQSSCSPPNIALTYRHAAT